MTLMGIREWLEWTNSGRDGLEQFYRNTNISQNFDEGKGYYVRMRDEYNIPNRIYYGKI